MNENPNPAECESQAAAILLHLQERGPITPLEALNRYGCFRLGARIWDLRRAGHRIDRVMIPLLQTRKRVAEYRLVTAPQPEVSTVPENDFCI